FTLANWFSERGFADMSTLPSYIATILANDIELSMYLGDKECDRHVAPYLSNSSSCSSDCPLTLKNPVTISNEVSCHIPHYCTAADICVYIPLINRNIHAYLRLHSCDALLEVGIEQFTFSVGLFDYEFGKERGIILKDVFMLKFRIDDLTTKGVYVVGLDFNICFTNDSCEQSYAIFDRTVLPKLPCSWDMRFKNQYQQLLETLGVAPYIGDNNCYRSEPPFSPSQNGWNTECPSELSLAPLPSGIGCYISDMCTAIRCCLEVDIIKTSVQFYVTVDGCEKQLTVGIEQMNTVKDISGYKFGSWDRFYLNGVYKIDFKIENFHGGRKYVVDMNVSACFESHGNCSYMIPVLKRALLPKANCSWLNGFNNANFSLGTWKLENGVNKGAALSQIQFDVLANTIGISQYLKDTECALSSARPSDGWNNSCPLKVNLPALSNNAECSIDSSCLNINCCVFVGEMNRKFSFSLQVDDCNYQISASIENLVMERKLSAFEFGKKIVFDMDGLIALQFMVVNLEYKNKYMLDLAVDVQLEAHKPAAMSVNVLDDVIVPRLPCQVNSGFIATDFSLDKWMEAGNVSVIDEYQAVQLLEDVAIAPFMLSNECKIHSDSKIDSTHCPLNIDDLHVYGPATCSLTELCSGIFCCLRSPEIPVNFQIEVQIDACRGEITVGLGKLRHLIPFRNFTWGEMQTFSLYGVIKIELEISEPVKSQVYTVNLNASICLGENETCSTEVQVLREKYLTALPCDWSAGFLDESFKYEEWRNKSHYDSTQLPETGVEFYLSKIGVEPYLKTTQCDTKAFPYISTSAVGWASECPSNASFQPLPDHTRCFMDKTCSRFQCCSYVNMIQRSFDITFKLDPCSQTLIIGIERILKHISLTKFEFGAHNKFYLNGFVRLDYLIKDLPIQRVYVASVNLSICLDHENCQNEVDILRNEILPQSICKMNPGYTDKDFSLTQWKEDRNISIFGTLDHVEEIELMTDLGVYPYMMETECAVINSNISQACGVVPSFPPECSLSDTCSRISCCIQSDILQRRIFYELDFDRCNHVINITIETFSRTLSLYDFKYGKEMTISLYSALKMKFMVDYLVMSQSHFISLNISQCFESNEPCTEVVEVLKEQKFSSEDCPINKNYRNDEFSLTEWASHRNMNATKLPAYARKVLHRDLGISQYLKDSECVVMPYNDSYGWNSDCADNVTLLNITDADTRISCNLQTSCSDLNCCFHVDGENLTYPF
ncbi:uncharacterized protein LOC132731425, partial [Ruditapes philippinarum]|uniref:uncharacterized protein LOC132731425 n=1 Tax=Ruditapes philippinarum TaxID=129788 RepID=UPI00295B7358